MDSLEEIAMCEYCNKTGPKDSFYSTTKRFCTAACSHSFSAQHRKSGPQAASGGGGGTTKPKSSKSQNLLLPSESERHQCISMGFDWGAYLVSKKSSAATVEIFQHAPMSAHWGDIGSGMKVEVLNLDCNLNTKVFWIASVIQVAGYKAKLRYEGFGDDGSCDFWCNLCTLDVHAVGWCATIGKPLVPPQTIQQKYSNWKSFLVKRLTGAKTLPNDFQKRVIDSVKSAFLCAMRLEVVDKTRISRMRVGIIEEIIGGRLRLRYEDSEHENDDFWCHSQSALIHPIGWCEKVGHKILVATKDYKTKKGFKNARQELFFPVKAMKSCGFKVGMKLEAIDPLNLSAICVATVKKVLKNGYLMIGIDGSEAADGSDWFCYHCTAPSIFPVGFCMENGISLSVPKAYKDNFSWESYLANTHSQAAPVDHFNTELPDHGFKPGMKLEAVDLMEPRLICVATVTKVIGRLLQVHFDGWENQYDQWVDCRSPDIYPVGWCELVGYEMQPPPNMLIPTDPGAGKKKKLKGQSFVTKKKRKRSSVGQKKVDSPENSQPKASEAAVEKMDTETSSQPESTENSQKSVETPVAPTASPEAQIKEEAPEQSKPKDKSEKSPETEVQRSPKDHEVSNEDSQGPKPSETDEKVPDESKQCSEKNGETETTDTDVQNDTSTLEESAISDSQTKTGEDAESQEKEKDTDQPDSSKEADKPQKESGVAEKSAESADEKHEKSENMQENASTEEKMDTSVPEQTIDTVAKLEASVEKAETEEKSPESPEKKPEENADQKQPMDVDESSSKPLDEKTEES